MMMMMMDLLVDNCRECPISKKRCDNLSYNLKTERENPLKIPNFQVRNVNNNLVVSDQSSCDLLHLSKGPK